MKVLLLGANGQVGTELQRSLAPLAQVVTATRDGTLSSGGPAGGIADFDEPGSLGQLVRKLAPDIVVNAAAYTAVDRAESERDLAFRVNAEAPAVLAEACASLDALLVHYSTDYVFNGQGTRPYREDDPTDPLGVYGESKLAGEQAIRETTGRHLILRTAWVYAAHGHNFLRTMLRLGRERDELRVVADQVGTPTSAALIADVTAELLGKPIPQSCTLHLTASGETTWHGFAEAIFEGAVAHGLLERVPACVPITTADYPTPARRPAYSVLDTSALGVALKSPLPDWKAGLADVLRDPRLLA